MDTNDPNPNPNNEEINVEAELARIREQQGYTSNDDFLSEVDNESGSGNFHLTYYKRMTINSHTYVL